MALDFRPAREVHERALAILEAERARLMALLPWGKLSLTGCSSLPEALTRGDVDLLLRVPPADFEPSVRTLGRLYRPVSREMWTAEFATFELDGHVLPTGIAVTIADGEHDRYFRGCWQLLRSRPDLLAAYNELKRSHRWGDDAQYRQAKADFFGSLGPGC